MINTINVNQEDKVDTLDVSLETQSTPSIPSARTKWLWVAGTLAVLVGAILGYLALFTDIFSGILAKSPALVESLMTKEVLYFMLVGFAAQAIDGALGMAYGVSSTSFLLGLGVPPAIASSSVHVAEVFTSGVSGLSHLKLGNVNKKLFRSLVLPGMAGAIMGAYILTNIDGNVIKPFVAVYLMIMGIVIIKKAFKKVEENTETKNIGIVALFGGFMDSVGGGGWGPIVASTLMSRGHNPRFTVGSVNMAEFFIAGAGAGTFIALIGTGSIQVIVGLILGGVFAAPFAAMLCKRIKPKTLMIMVGVLIIGLSIRTLFLALK